MTEAAITSKSPSVYPVFSVSCNLRKTKKSKQLKNAYKAKTARSKMSTPKYQIPPYRKTEKTGFFFCFTFFFSKVRRFERAELIEDHTIFKSSAGDNMAISILSNQTTHQLSNKQTDHWPYRQESRTC